MNAGSAGTVTGFASIGISIVVVIFGGAKLIAIALVDLILVTISSIQLVLSSGYFLIADSSMAGHTDILRIAHRAF